MVIAMLVATPNLGVAQTETPSDAFQEGMTLLQQGRVSEAIDRLTAARDEQPTRPAVWLALGQAYETARRVREAIAAYRRVVELAPRSDEAQRAARRLDQLGPDAEAHESAQRDFQAGVQAFGAKDYPTAEAALQQVIRRIPKHLPSLLLLGSMADLAGRTDDAQARWETAVATDPTFYPAQVNLGRLYERREAIDKAIGAYSAAVSTRVASSDVAFAVRRLTQLGSTPEQAAQIREWLRGANDALRTGRPADAQRFFEQVLAVLPGHAPANFGAALLTAKRGDSPGAVGFLRRGLEGDPDFYPALFLLGEIEAGQGQFEEAIERFTKVMQLVGPQGQGIEARRRLPGLEEAVNKRRALEAQFLIEARSAFNEGIDAFQRKDYEAAFKSFGKAMVLDEQNPYYVFNRGLAAFNIGNNLMAAKLFERAVELLPTYGVAHFWLALLFQGSAQQARDLGNLAEAQAEYTAAVDKFERAIGFGEQAWFLEEAQRRRDESLDVLGRYQEGGGHLTIGGALVAQGRLPEAIAEFERAAARFPWDFQPWLNAGAIYADQGAFDLAKAALERAIAINPRSAKPHNELGLLFERLSRSDDAIAEYRKAAELAPDSPPPHISIGTLLQQEEDYLGAIAEFERAIELSGGTSAPLVHFRLAFSYNQNGQLALALEQYRKTLALVAGRTEKEAEDLRNTASERAATLERSLRPYSINVRVTPWAYDSNLNSSETTIVGEVSTSVGGGIVYRLVETSTLRIRGGFDHNQTYYLLRSQIVNTSTSLSLSSQYLFSPLIDLSGSYAWSYGYGSSGPQSLGQSLGGSVTKRGQLPSAMSLRLSYGTSDGLGGSTIQNSNVGYGLSMSQTLKMQDSLTVSYSGSANDSNRADQVSQSSSIGLSYSRTLWKVLSASWSYRVGFTDLVNPFTVAEVRGGQRIESLVSRKSVSKNYGMDLSYVFRGDVTVSLGFNLTRNESNVSFDRPEDLSQLLTNQVQANGNFRKQTASFSVSKSF
jgi:tetratricopeptide (TPR) repeat protein